MRSGEFYDRLGALSRDGTPFVVATITGTSGSSPRKVGAKMLVLQDGEVVETIGGGVLERQVISDALDALRAGRSCVRTYELRQQGEHALDALCGGEATLFLDVHAPQRTLLVVGAGHVGGKLATLAKLLDYRVVVVDSRADMVARERLPAADELICGDPAQLPALVPLTERVSVVIVTHDHRHDADALRAVLDSPAGYIGMMGSAAKIRTIFGRLREEGVDPSALDRVHAPIGIDIGAQTPAELALCIMAEIVADGYARAEEAAAPAATPPADASAENAASGDRGSGG